MLRLRQKRIREEEAGVNPMDGLGNLADAMLVLAVGIMLALIINWKVDITAVTQVTEPEPEPEQIPISREDLQDTPADILDEEALKRVGALYYDEETGTYYAITGD